MKANCDAVDFTAPAAANPLSSPGTATVHGTDHSAGILHRTTTTATWHYRVDLMAIERHAHQLRQEYIAGLFGRAVAALGARYRRVPGRPSPKRALAP